jgi:hypothetical protein
VLYPGGITDISRGLSEATPPDRDAKKVRSSSRRDDRRGGFGPGWMNDSNGHGSFARSKILLRRFSEIESGSSGIPPGCMRCARLDPGVSSLALLNPRLMSVTPPGSRRGIHALSRGDKIESGSSGIPPGCVRCAFRDPGVSSLALLNPRLISVTPPGVKTRPVRVLSRDDAKSFRSAIRGCRRWRSSTPG